MASTRNAALVISNEQHQLIKSQKKLLNARFGKCGWELLWVPAQGWNAEEQRAILKGIPREIVLVFLSPIPLMLREAAQGGRDVLVFHTDKRGENEPLEWQLI